jgi:S1-C subfamily serine protease
MKKMLMACLASALAGAALGIWMTSDRFPRAEAQEVRRSSPIAAPPAAAADDSLASPRSRLPSPVADELGPGNLDEFTPEERTNILVYERTNRSVVHITTKVVTPDMLFSWDGPSEGAGSGSVLDKNGHILTNYHVIEDATEIRVTLHNGEPFDAGLVGRDPLSDIAVLRITAPPDLLFPIEFGDSTRLYVGQQVMAIGNPFGLERTLTVGTLSSLNRRLPSRSGERQLRSMIQIDAALNRGNSGGPLLNSQGRLIGMNTAILSPTGQNVGVGFALPVNTIKRVVPQLIEHGRVIRAVTGILSVYESERGLTIIQVTPGGPAERAGLRGFRLVKRREKRGPFTFEKVDVDRSYADTIIAADGRPIVTGDALQEFIDSKHPGERVVLRILRGGQQADVQLVLGSSE